MELVEGSDTILEDSRHETINDLLQKYRSAALNSLSGPKDSFFADRSASVSETKNETVYVSVKNGKRLWKRRHQGGTDNGIVKHFELHCNKERKLFEHLPTRSAVDECWDELQMTSLQGELISCFVIGGEKRLCLPQVLNSALRGVSVVDINNACDFLHIFCSTCSERQLCVLKKHHVLPPSATQCGLISKTDAERLCNRLLFEGRLCPQEVSGGREFPSADEAGLLHVRHTCFGKCRGLLDAARYSSPLACCIRCEHCGRRFSPRRFVVHAHGNRETRVVHWGFDSENWREYLLLCQQQKNLDEKQQLLDDVKSRFVASSLKFSSVDVPPEKRVLLEAADPGVMAPLAHLSGTAPWRSPALLTADMDKATDLTVTSAESCSAGSKPATPCAEQQTNDDPRIQSPEVFGFNLSSRCVSECSPAAVCSPDVSLPACSSLSSSAVTSPEARDCASSSRVLVCPADPPPTSPVERGLGPCLEGPADGALSGRTEPTGSSASSTSECESAVRAGGEESARFSHVATQTSPPTSPSSCIKCNQLLSPPPASSSCIKCNQLLSPPPAPSSCIRCNQLLSPPPAPSSCIKCNQLLSPPPAGVGEGGCTGDSLLCPTQLASLSNFQVESDPCDEDPGSPDPVLSFSSLRRCSCSEHSGVAARLKAAVKQVCDESYRRLLTKSVQQLSQLALKQQLLTTMNRNHSEEGGSIPALAVSLQKTSHDCPDPD